MNCLCGRLENNDLFIHRACITHLQPLRAWGRRFVEQNGSGCTREGIGGHSPGSYEHGRHLKMSVSARNACPPFNIPFSVLPRWKCVWDAWGGISRYLQIKVNVWSEPQNKKALEVFTKHMLPVCMSPLGCMSKNGFDNRLSKCCWVMPTAFFAVLTFLYVH